MPEKKFTATFLKGLDHRHAGKVFYDTGFNVGSLQARVAKSGAVTLSVKFNDPAKVSPTNKHGTRKERLTNHHPLLKSHGVRSFLAHHDDDVEALRDLAKKVIADSKGQGGDAPSGPMTVAQLKDAYIERRGKSAFAFKGRTAKDNLRQTELMLERAVEVWGGNTLVRHLTKTHAEELIEHVSENVGRTAANRLKTNFPKALKFAQRGDKAVDISIFKGLDIDPAAYATTARTTVLTEDERPSFFQALRDFEAKDAEPRAPRPGRGGSYRPEGVHTETAEFFRLIYLCAARRGEAEYMVWGEVDFDAGTWFMPEHKRKNREHTMYLPEQAIAVLKRQRARYPNAAKDARVFPMLNRASVWRDFQTIKKMAGITSDLTIHDLRASRATQWVREDRVSEAELAAMVGSLNVEGLVRIYVRDSASEDKKRARVNAEGDAELL
ncbi:MAG: tyrosine-type recombinase/integrase [Pseudomonadota bacterium]